jgi:hypothetical protein
VFKRLENANFRANLHKCFFAQEELEYLGYWLTRRGLQPQPKKVEAILRLTPPKTNIRNTPSGSFPVITGKYAIFLDYSRKMLIFRIF